ncbi:MAG TPA: aminotransferase class III-fold pyridoxal phosphate-dependent enzyme, partial [Halothiobacillaceae bacterium]|nr:aminotransferase class III-fold pyridoxal phosphate-dependent enzyme [Halothiobacillaceae bacterium]
VQAVLEKYDILFIADEVICGFGRTGNMFGTETYDLRPNMMTIAKALSSAYLPISAVLVDRKVYEAIRDNSDRIGTFGHGFTYGGHPVSAAVALETLRIYEERDVLGHVRRVMPRLQDGLRKFADHPLVGEVRGIGLVAAVELVSDKSTHENFDPALGIGPYCAARAQDHGLLIRPLAGDALAFSPPLVISEEEVAIMVERFGKALDDTAAKVQSL